MRAMHIRNGPGYEVTWVGIALLGALSALSQETQVRQSAAAFVGSWSATHRGAKYVAVRIAGIRPISGELRAGQIEADENGNVSEVVHEASDAQELIEPRVVGDKLLFKTKDSEGDVIEYEMTLVTRDMASLNVAGMPLKPFPLTRDRAAK